MPTKGDFERTLRSKYKLDESQLDLVDGPNGARGSFSLRGDLTPPAARAATHDRDPETIARAFFAAEVDTFGLASVDDLRGGLMRSEPTGFSLLGYKRYVGDLRLDDWGVTILVDGNGSVTDVNGYLVPLAPELFEAAAKPTIGEAEARAIAAAEQVKGGDDPNELLRVEKFAVPEAPYVVWEIRAVPWIYRVDAFTGAIIEKRSGIKT